MTIPRWILPILAIGFMIGGYALRLAFTNPTTEVVIAAEAPAGEVAIMEATVDGIKCKGTAGFFTRLYEGEPGVVSITTYAAEHKAVISYDPSITTPEHIQEVMEQEFTFRDGSTGQVFTLLDMDLR